MLPGRLTGYALHFGRGWTEDLIIADRRDIENVASQVHVKRFKSKEVGIKKLQEVFVFPGADGSLRRKRSRTTSTTLLEEIFGH